MLGGRSRKPRAAAPSHVALPYQVRTPEARHYKTQIDFCPLSLKDMCTLDLLPEIISAGVTSLKIEGRMKQPGYTAAVTGMYRKYLDILLNTAILIMYTDQDRQYLLDIFQPRRLLSGILQAVKRSFYDGIYKRQKIQMGFLKHFLHVKSLSAGL